MKYTEYNEIHRQGVKDAWYNILKPILIDECVPKEKMSRIEALVIAHDLKKVLDDTEYIPYNNHHENPDRYPKNSAEYRKAWNHHQKNNPHHWQYWVLLNDIDDPKMIALEMDYEYVIEMLCDWHSASTFYGHTAYWWWDTQKRNMILHPNTIKTIEKYINYLN